MTDVPSAKPARLDARQFALIAALGVAWAAFTLLTRGDFVSARNIGQLAIDLSSTTVVALGMLLIMLIGHIDLSVGSGIGLAGAVAAVLISEHHVPAPLAMLAAGAVALVIWMAMGWIVARERIPAFIITLAGMLVFAGAAQLIIGGQTVPVRDGGADNLMSVLTSARLPPWGGWLLAAAVLGGMAWGTLRSRASRRRHGFPVEDGEVAALRLIAIGQGLGLAVLLLNQGRGVPVSLVLLGFVALLVWIVTDHTRMGRWLYACGSNEQAAALSGVPVRLVTVAAFACCGLLVAVTGFLQTAYVGNCTTTTGRGMELDAIAACVIGGVSVKGGRGTVGGVLIGALLIATLVNGLTLMSVPPETSMIIRGLVLAAAVWMDVRLNRR